ncbi:MAG: ABC-F family ATP-binding cassette domain-containing protein [Clostridiales bacterium]|nr:ABC-F family ATP-binding cassette domain-containing protein [Clostridiales bacterium]MBR6484312.1 ABC-F family ATP-binding cassette domain-containing protein [Clostridiales bacterium]
MAQISVNNLGFTYEGSWEPVFENVSFNIDTDWKLGFIGRNGKGKTTFLDLLRGKYEYSGSIGGDVLFDYFPYEIKKDDLEKSVSELLEGWKPMTEEWRVLMELPALKVPAELMYRPIGTLSFGERTKLMLAVLFSGDNDFLLIDEPTNHLDAEARQTVKEYLSSKKGFILVSHDRDLLDAVIDHVLVLNRKNLEVGSGNFTTWWENKERRDSHAKAENEKHLKEIGKLKSSMDRSSRWAEKNENTKIGFDPLKEPDRCAGTRSYIGGKTKKMEARVKSYQVRMEREIGRKEGLLEDIEQIRSLKLSPLEHPKKRLLDVKDYSLGYKGKELLFSPVTFEIMTGEIVFLTGANGCGKSSFIKSVLNKIALAQHADPGSCETLLADAGAKDLSDLIDEKGRMEAAPNMIVSYINQDTTRLHGDLTRYAQERGIDVTQFFTVLRQLDLEQSAFEKDISTFSEGQKKKVLIAGSLVTPAHLYIWDEPLNYIDVFSRMQIEELIEKFSPTMLIVEHDVRFKEKFATKTVGLL